MDLPKLDLMFLTFRLEARESVVLPPFLGSTLRGAFGKALKQVFCFVPQGICKIEEKNSQNKLIEKHKCWFFEACPYQYIFESPNLIPSEENHPQLRGQKNLPHPFVLIPPAPRPKRKQSVAEKPNFNEDFTENHFSRGDCFDFSILLLGKAAVFWAQVAVAVRLFEQNGLGEHRKPFALREAFAHDASGQTIKIFDSETKRISSRSVAPVRLDWLAGLRSAALENDFNGSLHIHFETPARIRIDDQIETKIPLSDFLKKLTERLEHLARVHAAAPEKLDYREFIADAEDSITSKNQVRLYKYTQKSERQEKLVSRDVAVADIILHGKNISKFLPLLTAGEILQIGADTSHGFGRFIIKSV